MRCGPLPGWWFPSVPGTLGRPVFHTTVTLSLYPPRGSRPHCRVQFRPLSQNVLLGRICIPVQDPASVTCCVGLPLSAGAGPRLPFDLLALTLGTSPGRVLKSSAEGPFQGHGHSAAAPRPCGGGGDRLPHPGLTPPPSRPCSCNSEVKYASEKHFRDNVFYAPVPTVTAYSETIVAAPNCTWRSYRSQLTLEPRPRALRFCSTTIIFPKQARSSFRTTLHCRLGRPSRWFTASVQLQLCAPPGPCPLAPAAL